MKKELATNYISLINRELSSYYEKINSFNSFQFYRFIESGIVCLSSDNYKIYFGFFTDSKSIKKIADSIVEKLHIPHEDICFRRILQKHYKPKFLSGFGIGSNIRAIKNKIGTVGLFVEDNGCKKAFITCGHVLPYKMEDDRAIVYCQYSNNWKKKHLYKVGKVIETFPPQKKTLNSIDAALAILDGEFTCDLNILNSGQFKGRQLKILPDNEEVILSQKVFKIGRNNSFKSGIIRSIAKRIVLNSNYNFEDVYGIIGNTDIMAVSGDSGGPVFIEKNDELFCIGIVFGIRYFEISNSIYSEVLICPIHKIISRLKLKPL